jgi:hypothetical protein
MVTFTKDIVVGCRSQSRAALAHASNIFFYCLIPVMHIQLAHFYTHLSNTVQSSFNSNSRESRF